MFMERVRSTRWKWRVEDLLDDLRHSIGQPESERSAYRRYRAFEKCASYIFEFRSETYTEGLSATDILSEESVTFSPKMKVTLIRLSQGATVDVDTVLAAALYCDQPVLISNNTICR